MKPNQHTESIRKAVLTFLEDKQKAKRHELFVPALKVFNLTKADLTNRKPDGNYSIANSMTGIVINEMISLGVLIVKDEYLMINKPTQKTNAKDMIEYFSKKLLTEDELKERGPESKLNVIKSLIGNMFIQKKFLAEESRDNVLEFIQNEIEKSKKIKEKLYNNQQEDTYPVTPIGNLLREHKNNYLSMQQKKLSTHLYNKSTINIVGQLFGQAEEFFEVFVFNLIKKIYGDSIVKEKFLAGPDDDGVDCEFEIKDPFGFKEKLIIQAKTKKTEKNLNIKILREYLGVMLLKQAQKCVIITNSNFNKTAISAAKNVHSVVLIGLQELFDYMLKHQYGLIIDKDKQVRIDEDMFLSVT
jgi:restriction endonuclease Mrr